MSKIHMDVLMGVGIEGAWGILLFFIVMPLIWFMKLNGNHIDDMRGWVYQVQQEPIEIMLHMVYSFCTLMSSYAGLNISATLSSASRATIDAARIILIWAISMALQWEKWHNISTPVRLVGFIMIVFGVTIYNNAFKIIPFLRQVNIN